MRWITVTIILHNLIIDVEGAEGIYREWEDGDAGEGGEQGNSLGDEDEGEGEGDAAATKRNQLIAELLWARHHERL